MCIKTITIKVARTGDNVSVPCGKCEQCRARRISGWSFRLMQEEKVSTSSYFITLTYDTDNVPITKKGWMALNKRDLQLFFKRLRFGHPQGAGVLPIKYYAAGEYGGKSYRPHYHVIFFNLELSHLLSQSQIATLELTDYDGATPVMSKHWPQGHITVGRVTHASVGYTLKYICKPSRIPMHSNDDRQPEFSLMSKSWGLITSLQK